MRTVTHIVEDALDGAPLWCVLEDRLFASAITIKRAKRVPGAITLDGTPARSTSVIRDGQEVALAIDDVTLRLVGPEGCASVEPQPGPLDIVYEDEDLVVVNKPAGLVVHPCSGQRDHTLGNFLLWHLLHERGIACALHPVHRLDVGTTGLIAFATSGYAQARLQAQLERGVFVREYLAVCEGVPAEPAGVIAAPIGRVGYGPRSWDVCPNGNPATTHYQVVCALEADGSLPARSLVRLRLETGRTHQVRVHMAHLGHPLLGDAAYGFGERQPEQPAPPAPIARPALHSAHLRCVQPVTGAAIEFEQPLPADMTALLA